ncbi:ABC transporter substrate-binding protein [Paenibacillus sp. 481]|uniref:ABC transporter substrate-binding protein n=1 Tax=Paenibacillus sp. 481 TaxID=2835869 RepID=UPI001E462AC8|nr:ABC transporter substrate-binding protein [Paenibacillus sp. 481]UHA73789.1 ABC transporter substrate-binding protein [Paenibacillus sp. 481]
MKKRLTLLISITLLMSLIVSACGGGGAPKEAAPKTETKTEQGANDAAKTPEQQGELLTEGVFAAADKSKSPAVAANRKDTVIIGMTAPAGVFNPLFAESAYDKYITQTIFEPLMKFKKDGTFTEGLAQSYALSDDKLKHTIKLKEGLKFSDGTDLTAEDVAYSLTIIHDKGYDGPTDALTVAKIKGGKEYKEGKAKSVEGIKVIDPLTVEVTTAEVTALAYAFIAETYVMPKGYYGKADFGKMKEMFTTPIGAGAYKLTKFVPGQEAQFVANEHFHLGKPPIQKLIYKFTTDETNIQLLQTGETDMDFISVNQDSVAQLKDLGFADVTMYPTNGYGYIGFNHALDKFKDKRVRQALTYGLNRQEIVDAVYSGYADVINIPQSKLSWAYTDEVNPYAYDLTKAKQLLDEAGWKVGADGIREKDGQKFKINFVATTPNPVNEAIIPVAQANYKELGIDFVPEQLDFNAVLEARKKGDFDMVFLAWGLDPDPQTGQNTFKTTGYQNDYKYSNKKVDELYEKADKELDIEKRKAIYKELYKEINEDLPYMFLYQRRDMWGTNARIQGFDMSPYRDFTNDVGGIKIN